jgi:hypothetical protein
MKERILVLMAAYGSMMLYEFFQRKKFADKREKAVYLILMLVSLYLGLNYAWNRNWVQFYDLAELVFGKTARSIDKLLTAI